MAATPVQERRDYVQFRACCARQKVVLGGARPWTFFDLGHKAESLIPLVCVPGATTNAESFFIVLTTLGSCGFRVIAVDYPPAYSFREWAVNLAEFLDFMKIPKCHLFGINLGGHLSLWFAKMFPSRLASMILCNSFASTAYFHKRFRLRSWLPYLPAFLLRRFVLDGLPSFVRDSEIAASLAFVISRVEDLSRDDLSSRIFLQTSFSEFGAVDDFVQFNVTLICSLDDTCLPASVIAQQLSLFPHARKAYLKSGGDFPMLSRPEDIIFHLRAHLSHFKVPDESSCNREMSSLRASAPEPRSWPSPRLHPSLVLFKPPEVHPTILKEDQLARRRQRLRSPSSGSTGIPRKVLPPRPQSDLKPPEVHPTVLKEDQLARRRQRLRSSSSGSTEIPRKVLPPRPQSDLDQSTPSLSATVKKRLIVPPALRARRRRLLKAAVSGMSTTRGILSDDSEEDLPV